MLKHLPIVASMVVIILAISGCSSAEKAIAAITPSISSTKTNGPTYTLAPTRTPTATPSATTTPTSSLSPTATAKPTSTPTSTPTVPPTLRPTRTQTRVPTSQARPSEESTNQAPLATSTAEIRFTQVPNDVSCPLSRTEYARDGIQVNHYLDGHFEYLYSLFIFPSEGRTAVDFPNAITYAGRIASNNGDTVELILYQRGFQGGKPILTESRRITFQLVPDTIYHYGVPEIYELPNHLWTTMRPDGQLAVLPNGNPDPAYGHGYGKGCRADLTTIPDMVLQAAVENGVAKRVSYTR